MASCVGHMDPPLWAHDRRERRCASPGQRLKCGTVAPGISQAFPTVLVARVLRMAHAEIKLLSSLFFR